MFHQFCSCSSLYDGGRMQLKDLVPFSNFDVKKMLTAVQDRVTFSDFYGKKILGGKRHVEQVCQG
jgi:hypothetical protein